MFFLGFARARVKRPFLISAVSAGTMTLFWEWHVALELRVELAAIRYLAISWIIKMIVAIWELIIGHLLIEHFSLKVIHINFWHSLRRTASLKCQWLLSFIMASMRCCDFVCVLGMWIADDPLHSSTESPLLFRSMYLSYRGAKVPTGLLPVTGFVTSIDAVAGDLRTTLSGFPIS